MAELIKQRLDDAGIPCVLVESGIAATAGAGGASAAGACHHPSRDSTRNHRSRVISGRERGARAPSVKLAQPVERLALELAAAFRADTEPGRDLVMALDRRVVQAVAPHEHLAVLRGKCLEHSRDLSLRLELAGTLRGRRRSVVDDEVGKR